jgi:co-chaperonin GroES (HSP10)
MAISKTLTGTIIPLSNKVFVKNLERGLKVHASGIVISDDTGQEHGIRDRWAEVYAIGPDVDDIHIGEWVLVEHGRWTTGIDYTDIHGETFKLWVVEYPKSVSVASPTCPLEYDFVPMKL